MAKKDRKALIWAGCIILGLLCILVALHLPTRPVKIIISPETTVIDGPLNPDGTVNYVAALDAEFAEGVTSENNAAIVLLQALGPQMLPDKTRGEILRRLGLTDLEVAKPYVRWETRPRPEPAAASQPGDQPDAPAAKLEQVYLHNVTKMLTEGQVHPELEAWLEDNAEALDLIVAATARPRYYVPLVSETDPPEVLHVPGPLLNSFRDAGEALAARAMLKLHRGQVDSAWADVLAVHRLARLLGQAPGVIDQGLAFRVDGVAFEGGRAVATRGKLTDQQARQMLADLQDLEVLGRLAQSIDRWERFQLLDAVMMMARAKGIEGIPVKPQEGKKLVSVLDWNPLLRMINRWHDRLAEAFREPDLAEYKKAMLAIRRETEELESRVSQRTFKIKLVVLRHAGPPFRWMLSEAITDLCASIFLPSFEGFGPLQEQARMKVEIEKLAFALAGHRARTGAWPEELSELAPAYLPEIPRDRFSGGELIYQVRDGRYILYSVGMNGVDDGGVADQTDKDDIVAEVK